jgi:hypothetical protein
MNEHMSDRREPYLRCEIIWSDDDLIEIAARVSFAAWGGAERAYLTREEARSFAAELEAVFEGGSAALLDAGQPDLSWIRLEVFEFGAARRLGLHVALGRAADTITGGMPGGGRAELRITTPLERGSLQQFARTLLRIVTEERGEAYLPLPEEWQ